MCGLFGFAGKMDPHQRSVLLRSLCLLNDERGEDSVGLACVNRNRRKPQIYRNIVPPLVAIGEPKFAEICDTAGQVWIGHTRYATRGKVTVGNAHPFLIGDVLGAHNGMIDVTPELVARCDNAEYNVDSQYLFHLLNRDGEIGRVDGCAALTWCELKGAADVSLIRHGNPLFVAEIPEMSGLAWSSELAHLRRGLAIAGVRDYDLCDFRDKTRWDVYLKSDGTLGTVQESGSGMIRVQRDGREATTQANWREGGGGWDVPECDDDDVLWMMDNDEKEYFFSLPVKEQAEWLEYYGLELADLEIRKKF